MSLSFILFNIWSSTRWFILTRLVVQQGVWYAPRTVLQENFFVVVIRHLFWSLSARHYKHFLNIKKDFWFLIRFGIFGFIIMLIWIRDDTSICNENVTSIKKVGWMFFNKLYFYTSWDNLQWNCIYISSWYENIKCFFFYMDRKNED